MRMFIICIVWGAHLTDHCDGESVTHLTSSESKTEGEAVILKCAYDIDWDSYGLLWYRQQPGAHLEYILRKDSDNYESKAEFASIRFTVGLQTATKFISLHIAGLELSDSAYYYCALRRWGWDYEKLIFGSGTELIVEPKLKPEQQPQLSILYPPLSQDMSTPKPKTAAVCLLSKFYPKGIEVSMAVNETINVTTASSLTANGYYSSSGYLQFPDDQHLNNITCTAKHESQEINLILPVEKRVPEEVICETRNSSYQNASDISETNFMSLTVMGLRILFFKSIAFNILMTARVCIF